MRPWNIFTIYILELLATTALALYRSSANVIELTSNNFDELVIDSNEVWIVQFFSPWCGHCQDLVPEIEKVADVLIGIIKVGAVDVEENDYLSNAYDIDAVPIIKIFGADKNQPEEYRGDSTAREIIEAAMQIAKSKIKLLLEHGNSAENEETGDAKDVIELTDRNFERLVLDSEDMWMVDFFVPWCSHCMDFAPHWAIAASQLKGKVKFGALDATVNGMIAREYAIEAYPTIKFFAFGKKDAESVEEYEEELSSGSIVAWVLKRLEEETPPPNIQQITEEDSLNNICDQKPLCVIAFLPNLLDCQAECRRGYIRLLKGVGKRNANKMWGWLWTEAGVQNKLETVLEIGGFGYPAMAVVSTEKMIYSTLRGSFSKDGIDEFLQNFEFGREITLPLKGAQLPKIVKAELWNGEDVDLSTEAEYYEEDEYDEYLAERDEL